MPAKHEFSSYEHSIVNTLVDLFFYNKSEAMFVVNGYSAVIDRIGIFDNPKVWAEKLDEAMRYNITPDMWMDVL